MTEDLVPRRVQEGSTIEADTGPDLLWKWSLPYAVWLTDIREKGCPTCGLNFGTLELLGNASYLGPFICSECGSWILVMADGIETSRMGFIRQEGFVDYPHRHKHQSPTIAFLRKPLSQPPTSIDGVVRSDVSR